MYVDENNRATAFVVDIESKSDLGIPLATLDTIVDQQNISSLDFIKIDVEGCELEVLKGSLETIKRFKPVVLLEMNHWCLNVFRRVSLPEFHDNLFDVFPYVFAVEQGRYLDFSDPLNVGEIFRAHVFENKYMHIVAGFDKDHLISKLERIKSNIPFADHGPITLELPRTDSEIQLQALLDSTSWKITAPIRKVVTMLRSIL
ncbi:methyltransferase, FkbM family [compost metagenome]